MHGWYLWSVSAKKHMDTLHYDERKKDTSKYFFFQCVFHIKNSWNLNVCISSTALVFELFMLELLQTATQSTFLPMPLYFLPRLLSSKLHSWLDLWDFGEEILKKRYSHFFSHLSARCPCAFQPMAAIDINHAHLVQWGHANSQRGVYNKSPRDEQWSKMEKKHHFCSKK